MNPALEKLTKVLRLEAARGYDNGAVFGGLDRLLGFWQQEARQAGVPEALIRNLVTGLADYPTMPPAQRREALQRALAALEGPHLSDEPSAPKVRRRISRNKPPLRGRDARSHAALDAPLTSLPGIGPKTAKTLARLGLETLGDLLWHLPRRYNDYSQLKTIDQLWFGEEVTVIGTLESLQAREARRGRLTLVEAVVSDGTGMLRVTWFNQPWIADRLKPGQPLVLSGKVDQYLGHLTMNSPEWEPLEGDQVHTNRIVPVYPLTSGVSQKWLRKVIRRVVDRLAPRVQDPLPEAVRQEVGLPDLPTALRQVHFPDSAEALHEAQRRLAFDELFYLQLGVLRQKQEWEALTAPPLTVEDDWLARFESALPFELTAAQRRALAVIRADLAAPRPMNRLLEGDVGSGKTVVAAAAIGIAVANSSQAALMAPTSILAEQHYRTLLDLLPRAAGVPEAQIALLQGATPEAEKRRLYEALAAGEITVVVGTHALIEDPVAFADLQLAVIDEQHRFGVRQRAALRAKGENPNLLVMTATPIPRSLALTIFGDLDLTVIDEMPPGRQPVETRVLRSTERGRAYEFIRRHLAQGRQAFIIYPLVEESERVEARAVIEEHERLRQEVFPEYSVGLLHGRMSAEEKEAVMQAFREGQIHVLASTAVVEVGVDVPNATVMLIEGANRFGLAQLHQFRGRVGRGRYKAYCLLIPDGDDQAENERLKAMEQTQDGFQLAELDLIQRGPGDFLGTRQSGYVELRLARLTDVRLIEAARRQAQALLEKDPNLEDPAHRPLAEAVARFWRGKGEIS